MRRKFRPGDVLVRRRPSNPDEGWVAVGVLEEPNYFRTVSQA